MRDHGSPRPAGGDREETMGLIGLLGACWGGEGREETMGLTG